MLQKRGATGKKGRKTGHTEHEFTGCTDGLLEEKRKRSGQTGARGRCVKDGRVNEDKGNATQIILNLFFYANWNRLEG